MTTTTTTIISTTTVTTVSLGVEIEIMSNYNQNWATSHPSATNGGPAPSHPPTTQQNGASTPQYQPRSADTVNSAINRQIHPPPQFSPTSPTQPKASHHSTGNATSHDRVRHPVVSPTAPRPTGLTPGLEPHSAVSGHQQWVLPGDSIGGHFSSSSGQQPIYNNMASTGRRPTNSPPDASPIKCRIPDCTYNAYYDDAEKEQTEYCGQGHELQAVSTGLMPSCAVCKGRPRRTGERVCGRTCRERERQARPVQGSYYGVPVVRHEPRAARPA